MTAVSQDAAECLGLVKMRLAEFRFACFLFEHVSDQSGINLKLQLESLILAQNERWRQA